MSKTAIISPKIIPNMANIVRANSFYKNGLNWALLMTNAKYINPTQIKKANKALIIPFILQFF